MYENFLLSWRLSKEGKMLGKSTLLDFIAANVSAREEPKDKSFSSEKRKNTSFWKVPSK